MFSLSGLSPPPHTKPSVARKGSITSGVSRKTSRASNEAEVNAAAAAAEVATSETVVQVELQATLAVDVVAATTTTTTAAAAAAPTMTTATAAGVVLDAPERLDPVVAAPTRQ